MNNWIATLFSTRRNMFGRRRNNRNILWATIVGLGASAAAVGVARNNNGRMMNSVRSMMSNIRYRTGNQMPNMTNLAEFSKELLPNNNMFKDK